MTDLLCAFCFALPGDDGVRPRPAAVTIIQGHATCGRHAGAAAAGLSFGVALAAAELTENRAAMTENRAAMSRMADELTDARENGRLQAAEREPVVE